MAKDGSVVFAGLRSSNGAELTHADAVAPAAATESEGPHTAVVGSLGVHHEHAAVQHSKQLADLKLAPNLNGSARPGDFDGARAARDTSSDDCDRSDGPHLERS